jgi:hypothetical protein
VVPVRDAGQDLSLDVGQDRRERLTLLGGRGRKRLPEFTRTQAGEHGQLLALGQVLRDPIDEPMAFLAEDLEIDVSGQG